MDLHRAHSGAGFPGAQVRHFRRHRQQRRAKVALKPVRFVIGIVLTLLCLLAFPTVDQQSQRENRCNLQRRQSPGKGSKTRSRRSRGRVVEYEVIRHLYALRLTEQNDTADNLLLGLRPSLVW